MPYATVDDMIQRFGPAEMARLSTPDDQDVAGVVASTVDIALEDASATIDSYIRLRYATPLEVAPPEIVARCRDIARYELATGGGRTPSTDLKDRHDAAIRWCRDVADGQVKLDLREVSPGDESYAAAQVRAGATGDGLGRAAPFGDGYF